MATAAKTPADIPDLNKNRFMLPLLIFVVD